MFRDVLDGFQSNCGTGKASIVANIFQQLAGMRNEAMYNIFIYLHKSYNATDLEICLDILYSNGVGPRTL